MRPQREKQDLHPKGLQGCGTAGSWDEIVVAGGWTATSPYFYVGTPKAEKLNGNAGSFTALPNMNAARIAAAGDAVLSEKCRLLT
jgi:hypothetical protein